MVDDVCDPSTGAPGAFGIVANVLEPDQIFRLNAKSWIVTGTGGEGWERFVWTAMARGGGYATKWAPTQRFHNFRAAWIPPPLQDVLTDMMGTRGTREEMESVALELEAFAAEERKRHPNRRAPGADDGPAD